MSLKMPEEAIPKEVALQLCEDVRERNRGKWYTARGLWCWGCRTFSRGDPERMCFSAAPTHRGCGQVNALYTERYEVWRRA